MLVQHDLIKTAYNFIHMVNTDNTCFSSITAICDANAIPLNPPPTYSGINSTIAFVNLAFELDEDRRKNKTAHISEFNSKQRYCKDQNVTVSLHTCQQHA